MPNVVSGRDAIDLGNGLARSEMDDGTYIDWDITTGEERGRGRWQSDIITTTPGYVPQPGGSAAPGGYPNAGMPNQLTPGDPSAGAPGNTRPTPAPSQFGGTPAVRPPSTSGQPDPAELGRIAWAATHNGDASGWDSVDSVTRTRYMQGAARAWAEGTFGNNGQNLVNVWQQYGFDEPPAPPPPPPDPVGLSNAARQGQGFQVPAGILNLAESGQEAAYREAFGAYAEAVWDAQITASYYQGSGRPQEAEAASAEYARLMGDVNAAQQSTGAPPTYTPDQKPAEVVNKAPVVGPPRQATSGNFQVPGQVTPLSQQPASTQQAYRQQYGAYADSMYDAAATAAYYEGTGNPQGASAAKAEYARLNSQAALTTQQTGAPPTTAPPGSRQPVIGSGTGSGTGRAGAGSTATGRQGWPPGKQLWADKHDGDTSGWDAMVAAAMAGDKTQQGYLDTWNGEAQVQGYTTGTNTGQSININTGAPASAYSSTLGPGTETPFGTIIGKGEGDDFIGLPQGLGLGWHQLLAETQYKTMLASGYLTGTQTPTLDRLRLEMEQASQQAKTLYEEAALTGTYNGQATLASQQLKQQADQFAASLGLSQQELSEKIRQFSATLSEQTRQFDAGQSLTKGTLTGSIDGQQTLEAQKLAYDQQQLEYERAANPNRSFENELARGSTVPASGYALLTQPYTSQAPVQPAEQSFTPTVMPEGWTPGTPIQPQAQTPLAANLVRVPAVVNALRSGGRVSTAGQIGAPSTVNTAASAPITEQQFRGFNQIDMNKLDPDQAATVGSFARAGGVSDAKQKYLTQRGLPKWGSVSPSYSAT